MDNSLRKYVSGEKRPRGRDRALVEAAAPVYDEARLTALKVDGAVAVGEHAMAAIERLDDVRRDLARGDATKNELLADIELETIRQVKKLQSKLFNEFGI